MQIDRKETDGVTVLSLNGRLLFGDATIYLDQQIKQLVAEGATKILVNLENMNTIDSCGIGQLIAGFTTVRKSGGTLKVCSPTDQVLRVLQLVKLPAVIEVHSTEHEALASFDS